MSSFIIGLLVGILIGAVVGVVLISVATRSKIEEINRDWYNICLRITDDVTEINKVRKVMEHD